jgi:hypothetical protein
LEELPCGAARLDARDDKVLNVLDVVELMNCAFKGTEKCKATYSAADVVILINAVFLGAPPPPTC